MDADEFINDALAQMFLQAHAQFGNAVKSYWFNDSGICPGCGCRVSVIKYKGEAALSLNAFIYRERGVLIGYFLCRRCVKKIFRAAKRTPGQQTPLHTDIEKNLIAAYQNQLTC